MTTMTAEFCGGPIDGLVRDIAAEYRGEEPPLVLHVETFAPVQQEDDGTIPELFPRHPGGEDDPLPVLDVEYVRSKETVLHKEHGAVWRYVFVPPKNESVG